MNKKEKTEKTESVEDKQKRKYRRRVLAGITTGTVATVGAGSGGRWVKPVVDSVVLPAHAQTSPVASASNFRVRLVVDEADTENDALASLEFGDGTHTVDGFGDVNGIDDPHFEFLADFDPPLDTPVKVTMSLDADTDFDFGDLNTDFSQDVTGTKSIATLDSDDGADDTEILEATFSAPGFPTRNITVTFFPDE